MKTYENIDKALCREMEKLDKKYAGDVEMSRTDLETIRLLRSAMLKGQTIEAMEEDREWDDDMPLSNGRVCFLLRTLLRAGAAAPTGSGSTPQETKR